MKRSIDERGRGPALKKVAGLSHTDSAVADVSRVNPDFFHVYSRLNLVLNFSLKKNWHLSVLHRSCIVLYCADVTHTNGTQDMVLLSRGSIWNNIKIKATGTGKGTPHLTSLPSKLIELPVVGA